MKLIYSWMFFGGIVVGLAGVSSPSWGQSESEPSPTDATQPQPAAEQGDLPNNDALATSESAIAIDAPDDPWNRGVSETDRKAARELFLEGNRLFRIPLFARAAEKYAAALSKWKHPSIYLNLAISQLNAGQEVEARDSLEHALEHGEAPLGAENFHGAQQQLEVVNRQLGRLRVSCQTPGAQITLDGVPLFIGPGSYEGWATAKEHELLAKKPEYLSEARRVTIISGQLQDLHLKLITLSEAADASRRWAVWKPGVVTAVGGAILATSGVIHTLAFKNFTTYDDEITRSKCGNPINIPSFGCDKGDPVLLKANELLRRARRQQRIAVGGYFTGISLIAAGIVLLYMNQPRLDVLENSQISAKRISIIPTMSNDMLGILVDVPN